MPEAKPTVDIGAVTAKIYDQIKALAGEVGKAQGLRGLGVIIPAVILAVEEVKSEALPLTGEEKREVASRVLNMLINLPIIPEWIEGKIFDMAVEWFVGFFNRSFGHGWLPNVRSLLGG